jgi:hypothetical protein
MLSAAPVSCGAIWRVSNWQSVGDRCVAHGDDGIPSPQATKELRRVDQVSAVEQTAEVLITLAVK